MQKTDEWGTRVVENVHPRVEHCPANEQREIFIEFLTIQCHQLG